MERFRKKLKNEWAKWKKDAATIVIYVLLSVSCLVCYYLGIVQGQELKTYDSRITLIRSDGSAYSYMEAVHMRVRNEEAGAPFSYVLWGNEGIHVLQNPDLGRNAEVEILVVEGYSDLLLSSNVALDGTENRGPNWGRCCTVAFWGR